MPESATDSGNGIAGGRFALAIRAAGSGPCGRSAWPPLRDHDLGDDERLAPSAPVARARPPGAQAGGQRMAQSPTTLHISLQRRVDRQRRKLRPPPGPCGMPLRDNPLRPTVQAAAARRRVATQFPRDRQRRPPDLPGDLPHARALHTQDRELLPLCKRQMPLLPVRHRRSTR